MARIARTQRNQARRLEKARRAIIKDMFRGAKGKVVPQEVRMEVIKFAEEKKQEKAIGEGSHALAAAISRRVAREMFKPEEVKHSNPLIERMKNMQQVEAWRQHFGTAFAPRGARKGERRKFFDAVRAEESKQAKAFFEEQRTRNAKRHMERKKKFREN